MTIQSQTKKEESYTGQVNRIYYKDNIVAREKWYGDDKKLDSLKTYYKSGELNELFYYNSGFFDGLSYQFNKEGKRTVT